LFNLKKIADVINSAYCFQWALLNTIPMLSSDFDDPVKLYILQGYDNPPSTMRKSGTAESM